MGEKYIYAVLSCSWSSPFNHDNTSKDKNENTAKNHPKPTPTNPNNSNNVDLHPHLRIGPRLLRRRSTRRHPQRHPVLLRRLAALPGPGLLGLHPDQRRRAQLRQPDAQLRRCLWKLWLHLPEGQVSSRRHRIVIYVGREFRLTLCVVRMILVVFALAFRMRTSLWATVRRLVCGERMWRVKH